MENEAYQTIAAIHQEDWWYRGRERLLLTALRRLRQREKREQEPWSILDVGCGFGAFTHALSEFGIPRGLDRESQCIEMARQRYPHISFEIAAIPDQLPSEEFDLIVLLDVLEHLDERDRLLYELTKRLKPRGRLMITVPACPSLWTARDEIVQHRLRYRSAMLRAELRQAGLRTVLSTYFNTLLFLPIWLASRAEQWLHIRPERAFQHPERRTETLFAARPFLNCVLFTIFSLESFLITRVRYPFGVSLLAFAEKKECTP